MLDNNGVHKNSNKCKCTGVQGVCTFDLSWQGPTTAPLLPRGTTFAPGEGNCPRPREAGPAVSGVAGAGAVSGGLLKCIANSQCRSDSGRATSCWHLQGRRKLDRLRLHMDNTNNSKQAAFIEKHKVVGLVCLVGY